MPFYQFTVPADGASWSKRAEIAQAITRIHCEVTGAPASYVQASFQPASDSTHAYFQGSEGKEQLVANPDHGGNRLIGIIRAGRTTEIKRKLVSAIAEKWIEITGERRESISIWIIDAPGAQIMEAGIILPEASEDQKRT